MLTRLFEPVAGFASGKHCVRAERGCVQLPLSICKRSSAASKRWSMTLWMWENVSLSRSDHCVAFGVNHAGSGADTCFGGDGGRGGAGGGFDQFPRFAAAANASMQ